MVDTGNSVVFSFVRGEGAERVRVDVNLSGRAQHLDPLDGGPLGPWAWRIG